MSISPSDEVVELFAFLRLETLGLGDPPVVEVFINLVVVFGVFGDRCDGLSAIRQYGVHGVQPLANLAVVLVQVFVQIFSFNILSISVGKEKKQTYLKNLQAKI